MRAPNYDRRAEVLRREHIDTVRSVACLADILADVRRESPDMEPATEVFKEDRYG